jgi:hypothetical protein
MAIPWVPPRRSYHLRTFASALVLVLICLAIVLFGLRMEAIAHATGHFEARDQHDLRAQVAGVVELGWWEGDLALGGASVVGARVDGLGNGLTDPGQGASRALQNYRPLDGPPLSETALRFHKLEAGDVLWPGQPLALVQSDSARLEWKRMLARLEDEKAKGQPSRETSARLQEWSRQMALAAVRVPAEHKAWLAAKVRVGHQEAVKAGDVIAAVLPVDPKTHEPLGWQAILDIDERHAAHAQAGQEVRLFSPMYNQRLFGHADAVIEKVEPLVEPGKGTERFLRARAKVTRCPFPARSGSTFKAEIVVGRKQVYRIILEQ